MSVFYVFPPRPLVGDTFAAFLTSLVPGLDWDSSHRQQLAETLASVVQARPDTYVVFREDVAENSTTRQCLIEEFGAEAGDEVVELRLGGLRGDFGMRRWRLLPVEGEQ